MKFDKLKPINLFLDIAEKGAEYVKLLQALLKGYQAFHSELKGETKTDNNEE